ncbi:MAG: restriction endonuclease [Acetobacteraceae bacterium]|nr:restriction endonuclease [Acetobacteraceae bacterium]
MCLRPIPDGARASRHHLTPRLKGGTHKGTVRVHHICHQAIHARFTEAELARGLNDPAAIRTHPAMADFLAWIATKPPAFHAPTRTARGRTRKWR